MISGPPGLAMCFRCIAEAELDADLEFSGACSFCTEIIGAVHSRFGKGRVRAAVVVQPLAMCAGCLELMRDIMEEEMSDAT